MKTLIELISEKHPLNIHYAETYQNGVKPGKIKLEQFKEVLRLREVPALYSQDKKGDAATAYIKLFDPTSQWTWFILEWDGYDEVFAYICGIENEYGYASLSELAYVIKTKTTSFFVGIEIDMHFMPTPIGKIKNETKS